MSDKKFQTPFKIMLAIVVAAVVSLLVWVIFIKQPNLENLEDDASFNKSIGGQDDSPELEELDVDGVLAEFMLDVPFKAPKVSFYDRNDKEFSFANYRDNFIIIYFWASWCLTCNEELKTLQSLNSDFDYNRIDDIEILPISIDFKEMYKLNEFYQSIGVDSLDLFVDPDRNVMNALGVTSLPTTFLMDKKGNIIARINKHLDWSHDVVLGELMALKGKDKTVERALRKLQESEGEAQIGSEDSAKMKSQEAQSQNNSADEGETGVEDLSYDGIIMKGKQQKVMIIK